MSDLQSELAIDATDYYSLSGLSFSTMKHLEISPLRFWYNVVNPNRPEQPETPEMSFGTALHCAVLEPDKFPKRYYCELNRDEYDELLDTMDDLRAWLRDRGLPTSGKTKLELINRVAAADRGAPILHLLEERHSQNNTGKTELTSEVWERVMAASAALRAEPKLAELLSDGHSEVPLFAKDPATGVLLKCKIDWMGAGYTVDLKTFSASRGNSIDKAVTNAIWYEKYYRQAYWYSFLRSLQPGFEKQGVASLAPPCIFAFVESDPPYEVRLRSLLPKIGTEVNMLWERARIECRSLVQTYANYMKRFGDKPWLDPREIEPVRDEEIPSLAYS